MSRRRKAACTADPVKKVVSEKKPKSRSPAMGEEILSQTTSASSTPTLQSFDNDGSVYSNATEKQSNRWSAMLDDLVGKPHVCRHCSAPILDEDKSLKKRSKRTMEVSYFHSECYFEHKEFKRRMKTSNPGDLTTKVVSLKRQSQLCARELQEPKDLKSKCREKRKSSGKKSRHKKSKEKRNRDRMPSESSEEGTQAAMEKLDVLFSQLHRSVKLVHDAIAVDRHGTERTKVRKEHRKSSRKSGRSSRERKRRHKRSAKRKPTAAQWLWDHWSDMISKTDETIESLQNHDETSDNRTEKSEESIGIWKEFDQSSYNLHHNPQWCLPNALGGESIFCTSPNYLDVDRYQSTGLKLELV